MSNERGKIVDVGQLFERAQEALQGAGCPVNPQKAERLFAIAARAGHPGAQFYLGMMLRTGQGGKQDASEAALWLKRAANQGHGRAQFELGGLYKTGEGVRRNRVLALKWFILAGSAGDDDADMQCALVADGLSLEQQKRAMQMALRWKLRRDVNQVAEGLLEDSETLQSQEQKGQDDDHLPRFVRLSPPVREDG